MNKSSKMGKNAARWLAFVLFFGSGLTGLVHAQTDDGVDVDVTGDLLVVQACDFANQKAEVMYSLQEHTTGRTLRLKLAREETARGLRTGAKVRVRGRAKESEVTVAANGTGIQTVEAAAVAVTGEQNTIVMVLNFQDAANECSPSSINNLMFVGTNSVDGLYQATSFGSVWFTGNVVGPFTINYNSHGNCDYNGWAAAADAAAVAAGVNLAQYRHKVYVLPKSNPCSWAGLGTVGGNPSRAWIGICDLADVYAHELGHNLGMNHSATDANNDGTADCEYCDNSDIMGYSGPGLRGVNAPHKQQMGWIDASKVTALTGDAIINVAPLELDAAATPYPQVLKVAKPGTTEYYYFSYRRALAHDANLTTSYRDRTSVHHYGDTGGRTYLVATLADSGTFVDSTSGLTIRQLTHNNDFATVQVGFSCSRGAPTVSLSPLTANVPAGAIATYTLTVANTDSTTCGTSTFQITPALVSGWNVSVTPASLTLGPNQTGQVTISVTPPPATIVGTYPVNVAISDAFQSIHNGNVSALCSVTANATPTDQTAPTPPSNLTALGRKRRVKLLWTAATDNVKVVAYRIYRDGQLIAQGKRTAYLDKIVADGATYTYSTTAVDAVGNESAPSLIVAATVTQPSAPH